MINERKYQVVKIPWLDVYNKAAWKQTFDMSVRFSSIETCMPYPASGLTFGKDKRSVDRTKKLPWNVCIETPLKQLQNHYMGLVTCWDSKFTL